MKAVCPFTRFELSARYLLIVATAAVGCLVAGCAGSGTIRESQLAIAPTEATTSFSRSSQGVITELGLTPDILGVPAGLESDSALLGAPMTARALLISEAWYLRAQNDIEVPISESLDRYLRAAHYAYDALFADPACKPSPQRSCDDLLNAYNRAAREVARLTNNGLQVPPPDGTTYVIERSDGDTLNPAEWELTFNESTTGPNLPALGVAGAACQVLSEEGPTEAGHVRRCTPIAFLVTFARRADDGRSSAELATYSTLELPALTLHDTEVALTLDEREAWAQLLGTSSTPSPLPAELGCLSPTEPDLPTVLLALSVPASDYTWTAIASTLSSDPALHERFNFCVYNAIAPEAATSDTESLTKRLSALGASPTTQRPTVIVVAQGAQGEETLRRLKDARRSQRGSESSHGIVLAGSLVIPTPRSAARSAAVVASITTELSPSDNAPLNDIRRLLTRLSDSDDGVLGSTRRGGTSVTSGLSLSPVM